MVTGVAKTTRTVKVRHRVTPYSWKLFTCEWSGAEPGEHTVVSRAIDARATCNPNRTTPPKRSQWENNGQFIRKFTVA